MHTGKKLLIVFFFFSSSMYTHAFARFRWFLLSTDMREHGLVPDLVSYNSAINACGKAGELYEALSLLEEMEEARMRYLYGSLITKV